MNNVKMLLTIVLFFSAMVCSLAQPDEEIALKFEKGNHTFQNTTLSYRLFVPEDYDASKSYPLVLCLHGARGRKDENDGYVSRHALATTWANPENQKKNPCFVVAPHCPPKRKWNYVDWSKGSFGMDTVEAGKEMLTVIDLLDKLIEQYNIDEDRQYVTGISMGGYGTWDIIARNPDRFAAAAPMSGASDPSKIDLFQKIPIWAFHIATDKIVPVEGSLEIVKGLENSGIEVVRTLEMPEKDVNDRIRNGAVHLYTEKTQGNHGPWIQWTTDPKLHKWMFLQSKSNR